MSTSAVPSSIATASPTRRTFRRRYSVARGNWYQTWGLISGSGLLALAAVLGQNAIATVLMLVGLWIVYLNSHAIAHYVAGRLVGLRFSGLWGRWHRPSRGVPAWRSAADGGRSVLRSALDQGKP